MSAEVTSVTLLVHPFWTPPYVYVENNQPEKRPTRWRKSSGRRDTLLNYISDMVLSAVSDCVVRSYPCQLHCCCQPFVTLNQRGYVCKLSTLSVTPPKMVHHDDDRTFLESNAVIISHCPLFGTLPRAKTIRLLTEPGLPGSFVPEAWIWSFSTWLLQQLGI